MFGFPTKSQVTYEICDLPAEMVVGETLDVHILVSGTMSPLDWIGIYHVATPSLPGLSHSKWRYIESNCIVEWVNKEDDKPPESMILVRFYPHELPLHHGWFDVRIHTGDNYGAAHATGTFYIMDNPISPFKRFAILLTFVAAIAFCQHLLNAKGICEFVDPLTHPYDPIDDMYIRATADLNRYLIDNPDIAAAMQAVSSLCLDIGMLFLLFAGSTRRSSVRPFIALFSFFIFRFIAQLMAVIPCAPGYIWPKGKLFGHLIPTVFVDYHPANDMFFSGHTGTTLIIGIELFALDYMAFSALHFFVILPFVATWVVAARVHRGIDVVAGVLAAMSACAIAKMIAEPVDRMLQTRNHRIKNSMSSGAIPTMKKSDSIQNLSKQPRQKVVYHHDEATIRNDRNSTMIAAAGIVLIALFVKNQPE